MTGLAGGLLHALVRLWTGVPMVEVTDLDGPTVLFANHGSHLDTLVVWAAMRKLGRRFRPVAAADYWSGGIRGWIAEGILNALLIQRVREGRTEDPIQQMVDALADDAVLLVFPEGTRSAPAEVRDFKGGLHAIAERAPAARLIPLYLRNADAAWPKGSAIPLPLLCEVHKGAPLTRKPGEERGTFLTRARDALIALSGGRLQ